MDGARNAGVVTFHKLGDGRCRVTVQIDAEPDGSVEATGDALGWSAASRETSRASLERLPTSGQFGSASRISIEPILFRAFVFMPLTHPLMRGRNVRSLERLAELAEGRRPVPGREAACAHANPRQRRKS